MEKTRTQAVIIIRGRNLQAVVSDDPHLQVTLVDYDNIENGVDEHPFNSNELMSEAMRSRGVIHHAY